MTPKSLKSSNVNEDENNSLKWTRDSLERFTRNTTDISDDISHILEWLETESEKCQQSIRHELPPSSTSLSSEDYQPQSEIWYKSHRLTPTSLSYWVMLTRQGDFTGGMGFSGGQQLPMLKEVKDWDQWFRALKGMAKMDGIYGLLDGKLNRPKEGQFQDVLEFEAEDAAYQAALDRLEGMISMSLGMGAAAHVVTAEGLIKIISKLQSAYWKKSFTR